MPRRPDDKTEIPDRDGDSPSADEVISRLDRLWANVPTATPFPLASLSGCVVGGYVIDRIIGRGAFGVVYKAQDVKLKRDVALKIPRAEVLLDDEKLRRFAVEAQTAALLDHPGIVPLFEAELKGVTPYLASAYCPGPNLQQWLDESTTAVSERDAANFIATLAVAVDYAHQRGVVHRDLKPSNVLLMPGGQGSDAPNQDDVEFALAYYQPRVTDFGLAQATSIVGDTHSSLLLGTPLYMSPEQAECRQQQVGPTSDIFALGAILYRLLAGVPPFQADSYPAILARLRDEVPAEIRTLRPEVSQDLATICMKCLQKSPVDRYQSAAELKDDLLRFLNGQSVVARPIGRSGELRRWSRQPPRVSEAMIVVMVISVTRLVICVLGLGLLIFLNEAPLTQAELAEVLIATLAIAIPVDFYLIWAARRHRDRSDTKRVYWGSFLLCAFSAWIALLTATGNLPALMWYQRMPAARTLMFSLLSLLFLVQASSWFISDRARIFPNNSCRRRRSLKILALIGPGVAILGTFAVRQFSDAGPALPVGPETFIALDGQDDIIRIPDVGFSENEPFTLEAWFFPHLPKLGAIAAHGPLTISMNAVGQAVGIRVGVEYNGEDLFLLDLKDVVPVDQWSHLAVTYDTRQIRVFLNGRASAYDVHRYTFSSNSSEVATLPNELILRDFWHGATTTIGGHRSLRYFDGCVGELRLSESVFYRGTFTPSSVLSVGPDTRFLFHLDDSSDKIRDETGRYTANVQRTPEAGLDGP